MIRDDKIDQFARWAAVDAHSCLVQLQRTTREEAAAKLVEHLRWAMDKQDFEIISPLVSELGSLADPRTLPLIEEAYRMDYVGEDYVDLEYIQQAFQDADAHFRSELERREAPLIEDAVEEMRPWHCFREEASPDDTVGNDDPLAVDSELAAEWRARIVGNSVGRRE